MLATSFVTLSLAALALSRPLTRRAIDLGSCQDATIKFANGLDGRNTPAFAPNDPNSFNHGSALAPGVITSFICQQLNDKCKAPAASVTACNAGAAAANKLSGQAAADAFNAAVGGSASAPAAVSTDSGAASAPPAVSTDPGAASAPPAVSTDTGAAAPPAASGTDCVQATVTVTVDAAAATTPAAAATTAVDAAASVAAAAATTPAADAAASVAIGPAAAATTAAPAASGANLQTFTGALGGIAPPPVTAGGSKGFLIEGDEFINKAGALKRSCDVQHNLCADAANSNRNAGFSVSDCDEQDNACSALATN